MQSLTMVNRCIFLLFERIYRLQIQRLEQLIMIKKRIISNRTTYNTMQKKRKKKNVCFDSFVFSFHRAYLTLFLDFFFDTIIIEV